MARKRKQFDKELKLRTVELGYASPSIKDLAQELGIRPGLIYRWRSEPSEHKEKSFPGQRHKALSPDEAQIALLDKQLKEKDLELETIKKAIGIFSRKDGGSMGL